MLNFFRRMFSQAKDLSSGNYGWGMFAGSGSSSGVNVTPETALRVSAVYASVRVLAETLAQLPVHVYQRVGKRNVLVPDHPLNMVLSRRPNDWQTSFEFFEMMQGHLALRGNCYAQIVPGPNGSVTQLIPLRPDRMKVERLDNGRLLYLFRDETGVETKYSQDEIFHVRGMSSDGIVGQSPISLMSDPIGLTIAADKYGGTFFRNNARPSGILRADGALKPNEMDAMKQSWMAAHGGPDNAHRVAVLANGLQWQAIGMSSEDAQLLETRQFQITEIARIFRVPPHMIGDLSRSTFSNIEQQSLEFIQYTMMPWMVRWEKAIARDLIADDETYYAKFEAEGILRGDSAARSAYYRELINTGVMTINEARELEDMEPVEYGDVNLIQGAMIPLEQVIEQAEQPEPQAEGQRDTPDMEQDDATEDTEDDAEDSTEPMDSMTSAIVEARLLAELNIYRDRARIEAERAAAAESKAAELSLSLASKEASEIKVVELSEEAGRFRGELQSFKNRCEAFERENEKMNDILSEQARKITEAHLGAKNVIAETVQRLLKIEMDGIRSASKKPNMLSALDEFYAKHEKRLHSVLAAPCSVYAALAGDVDIETPIAEHLSESRDLVLELAGECTAEQITEAIDLLLCDWEGRANKLAERLTKGHTHAAA